MEMLSLGKSAWRELLTLYRRYNQYDWKIYITAIGSGKKLPCGRIPSQPDDHGVVFCEQGLAKLEDFLIDILALISLRLARAYICFSIQSVFVILEHLRRGSANNIRANTRNGVGLDSAVAQELWWGPKLNTYHSTSGNILGSVHYNL